MSRILLVDDDLGVREATALALVQWGHEVQGAADGQAALLIARAWRPDLVLLDIGLPGLDGFQVAAAWRQEPELGSCRIIAVSGLYREGDDARLAALGIDQLLSKPVNLAFLGSLLGHSAFTSGTDAMPKSNVTWR